MHVNACHFLMGCDNIQNGANDASGNKQSLRASFNKRVGHGLRPTSPKSPVASASAFGSQDGSDEDDNLPNVSSLDNTFLETNGDIVSFFFVYVA